VKKVMANFKLDKTDKFPGGEVRVFVDRASKKVEYRLYTDSGALIKVCKSDMDAAIEWTKYKKGKSNV